jgi:hypothetical protein
MKYYYLTYHDAPSGVYTSQVIDVIRLYRHEGIDIRLLALLSFRNFLKNRKIIKELCPNSIILPSFPKLKNWKLNKWILSPFVYGKNNIVLARGVFATNICFELKGKFEKIIYDGRGAIAAEQDEYGVYNNTGVENDIVKLEENAVMNSDHRIAVSTKLIEYWTKYYGYTQGKESVIPCSVSESCNVGDNSKDYNLLPGLEKDDILLIYSGSLSGWQSFKMLSIILKDFLDRNKTVKVLFLSKEQEEISQLIKEYPSRIYRRWVDPSYVKYYLALGDYGLLIRENNITNYVASPVKFSEYLMAGLNIILTPNIGDYSEFVQLHKCGIILNNLIDYRLEKVSTDKKVKNKSLAQYYFSKSSFSIIEKYKNILKENTC